MLDQKMQKKGEVTKQKNRFSRSERVIINLGTSTIAWGWPVLLALIITPVLVRELGNEAYGMRGLTTLLIGYFSLLNMGLNGAIVKYLAKYIAEDDKQLITELLGTTLSTYLTAGVVGGVIIWSLSEWLSTSLFALSADFQPIGVWAFRITGIGFFFSMLVSWGSAIPAGVQRFDVLNGIMIGFGTLTSLGSLIAVWLGFGIIGVVGANVVASIVTSGTYFIAARRLLPNIKIKLSFETKMFKETVIFGFWMFLFQIFAMLFAQTDRLMVGAMLSPAILTYYIVPHQLSSMVHQINAKMMQIIFPMASEFSSLNEKEKIKKIFLRGMNLSIVVGLSVALPLFVLSKPLLTFWLSPEIALESSMVLKILTIMYLLMGLTALPSALLSGIGFPQIVSIAAAFTGISSVIFYWLFIPIWGIEGAAIAACVSVFMTVLFYLGVSKKLANISLLILIGNTIRPLSVALVVGASMIKFSTVFEINSLFLTLVVFVFIGFSFVFACWFLGVFNSEEKSTLINFAGKFKRSFR